MPRDHDPGTALTAEQIAYRVAVIGLAARLPDAPNIDTFWANLCAGRNAIARLSDDELRAAGFADAVIRDPAFVRAYGMVDGVDMFDGGFFGYPRSRAEALDPQQRILLECAWTALEHAGYGPGTLSDAVGVYLSIAQSTYQPRSADDVPGAFFDLTSSDKDYAATRVSYKLGLTGPSMMVQTACSGSLAALHTAVEALLAGQCEVAIAGGCTIGIPQGGYRYRDGMMLSRSGTCRAFDAGADGAVPGSGAGIVVLKPLGAALADGDTIYSVVCGSALNNDGALKTDYLAPSVAGQARVIAEALSVAEVPADSIGYVEAHGTGTRLGDPIEIRALTRAYRHFTDRRQFCLLGSVKTSIGHLNVASGIAGFIKAVLAVHHGMIPPSLHFAAPNPEIDFDETPFTLATALTEWTPIAAPRRAGISSFGFGGTNVHVVIEQAPAAAQAGASGGGAVLLPISAKSHAALRAAAENLAGFLERDPDLDLADLAYTLQAGRQAFACRRAVVCEDAAEAVVQLRTGAAETWVSSAELMEVVRPTGTGHSAQDLATLARQWEAGATVVWSGLHVPGTRRRIAAPTYPFQRERYWAHRTAAAPAPEKVPASASPPAGMEDEVLGWLTGMFAAEVREDPASLDPDATFDRFGIDSLLVVSLTGKLLQRFPAIRSTLLFEQNTLRRLAAHLARIPPETPVPALVETGRPEPIARDLAAVAEPIAIVGLAGRYPGAGDLAAFWDNLRAGRSAIREVPQDRWDWRAHFDPNDPTKSYSRWAGFIDEIDKFDPLFFGISPREAKLLDPQQRIFLETVWSAVEDAGYTRAGLKESAQRATGGDVGVFVGVMNLGYRLAGLASAEAGQVVQANHWSVANRVSYLFDFQGPSLAVDTACSASLTALHLAVESVRRGECGAAIVGGVNLIVHPVQQLELCRMGMLSRGDRCHAFGAEADGFIQGEGVGAAVLKPLSAARRDGDQIYGVVLGSAINADGRTAGYTVPSPRAQAGVIGTALARAGVAAATISYVECHGTGTELGDPIEVSGLADALDLQDGAASDCAIGSVKSNIGHLESAAGLASLSKVLLQLRHETLAPSLNAEALNPRIDFPATRFRVQRSAAAWPRPRDALDREQPRRAGVSGFGAGGANAHVIVEEAPPEPPRVSEPVRLCLVPLSARSPERLRALCSRLLGHLQRGDALRPEALRDLAYTLSVGREAMECRVAFVVDSSAELIVVLAEYVSGSSAQPAPRDPPLNDLASHWRAGRPVDWRGVYAGETRRLVSLPTYPFAREHCWLPADAPPAAASRSVVPVGTPRPTLAAEANWNYDLRPDDPAVQGHRVGGVPILPGVSVLEMALGAARQLGVTAIDAIEEVYWLRPAAAPLRATLTVRTAGDALAFELCGGDNEVFSRGRLRTGKSAEPAIVIDAAEIAARCGRPTEAGAFYQRLEALGLSYDPGMRAVERIQVGDREALATVALPHPETAADCVLHPALLDAALQTAAFICFREPTAVRMLPFALERLDILGPVPVVGMIHARRLSDPLSRDLMRFEVTIADEHGVPALRLHELAGRPDARATTETSTSDWFYVPAWSPCPAEMMALDDAAVAGPTAVIADADDPLAPAVAAECAGEVVRLDLGQFIQEHARMPAPLASAGEICVVVPKTEDSDQPRAVLALLGLLRMLKADAGALRPIRLSVIAARAFDVIPGERGAAHSAACFGLVRVAAKECPAWHVRCFDLGDREDIPAALRDPGDRLGREIAYRAGQRQLRTLRPFLPAAGSPAFRQGGCYLILGGTGGIGLALAAHLAQTYRARLVLVGRSALSAERETAIARLRKAGAEVAYFRADATDGVALRSAVAAAGDRFGRIDGVIHAALVMEDRGLERMDRDSFRAAYDPKALGCVSLANALAESPPDWVAFFSSANSFATNAGQANYVAGCAFKDTFARKLAADAPFRVRIINWGFWGDVGRVATSAYRARLARLGVAPIGTAEGIAAIERIIAGDALQVLALKAGPEVLDGLGLALEAVDAAAPAPRSEAMVQVVSRLGAYAATQAQAMAGATEEYLALDRFAQRRLIRWWHDAGLTPPAGGAATADTLWERIPLAPRHRRQANALLDIVARTGLLQQAATGWCRGPIQHVPTEAALATEAVAFRVDHPSLVPHLELLEHCLAHYREVLADRVEATSVLFPDLSMSRVEAMYRGNRVVDYHNGAMAEAVAALAQARSASSRQKLRVLEFGAGTGGTSGGVLAALAAVGVPVEYVYTDVSLGFIQHGQRRFGERYPFVRFRRLDIEKDPIEQGFAAGDFDIVVGANVIHATARLDRSLSNLCRVLTPDGALVLYEMTAVHDFVTLTFGLLDGWWKAEDRRLAHAPLLDGPSWQAVLAANGFGEARLFGEPGLADPRAFRHSVIVALRSVVQAVEATAAAADAPAREPLLRTRLRAAARRPATHGNDRAPAAAPARIAALRQTVGETVAAALEMRISDLRADRNFSDYGADSIISVDLVAALNARLGIQLKPTALFSYPTVDALAAYIGERYADCIIDALSQGVPVSPVADAVVEPGMPPVVAEPVVPERPSPIAVVGMAGRFPGADDVATFWRNIAAGRDSVSSVPAERWDHAAIYDADPLAAGKTNCRHGGFLSDVASFDPLFFNLSPAEATAMDPQQRLFLQEAWHALEDAGYGDAALNGQACGVFVGTVAGDYDDRLRSAGQAEDAHSFMGNAPSMLAARIAYHLNLRGPSISIDTACSSSLVAIHMACDSLRRGETEMALAGGVAIMATPRFYTVAAKAGMLSPSGRCRTLDSGADGFVPAEAVGVVVLKDLAKARADGDHVYGVILGSGINQDGASNGITAPNARAQTELERAVHTRAGVTPDTIGYVELHGTGTRLGDPIELEGLTDAFGGVAAGSCAIGSVKSNIGHALAAAGVAGFIKVLLALKHRGIPPTLHLQAVNPHIDLSESPFYVPTATAPWKPAGGSTRRRAAVSSFGFSGTNAHLVVEEAPAEATVTADQRPWHLATISAGTERALIQRMEDLAGWLRQGGDGASFYDMCATLNAGRSHFGWRAAFVIPDATALAKSLDEAIKDPHARRQNQPPGRGTAMALDGNATDRGTWDRLRRGYLDGKVIDWPALYPTGGWHRVSLPTYPFEQRRCWPVEAARSAPPDTTGARPSLLRAVTAKLDRTLAIESVGP